MTTEQAELEIQRLQKIIQENKNSEIPKPLENPDFNSLIDLAKEHLELISTEGFSDDDSDHWFYEAAMVCVYGDDIWNWINKNSK